VLVPLDGSKLAEDALESAGSLAKALNVPVTLLEVGDRLQIFNEMWPQDPNIAARLQDQTAAYLESKAEELSAKGVEVIVLEFGPGDPAGVVVDMVDEVPGTLVVMTTHGRGGLKRWTLGSVADRVIRHSNGATLVIYSAEK
jgi:nucleotide-binding universal stress UspA family protein